RMGYHVYPSASTGAPVTCMGAPFHRVTITECESPGPLLSHAAAFVRIFAPTGYVAVWAPAWRAAGTKATAAAPADPRRNVRRLNLRGLSMRSSIRLSLYPTASMRVGTCTGFCFHTPGS